MMGVLADWQIKEQVQIKPWDDGDAKPGVISYGCTSYGYDIRLGTKFRECKLPRDCYLDANWPWRKIDPKRFDGDLFWDKPSQVSVLPPHARCYEIPAHGFVLAESIEWVKIPRDVVGICVGKSTYARCGLVVNVTPLEPEWEGIITLELSNTTPLPIVVYCGEGIAQVVFHKADSTACLRSYADKKGRYQGQTGLTLPFVEGA